MPEMQIKKQIINGKLRPTLPVSWMFVLDIKKMEWK
jgi:hypothetical protein